MMPNAGPGVGVEVGVGVLVGNGMLEAGCTPVTGVFGTCVGVLDGNWVGVLGGGTEVGGTGVASPLLHAMPNVIISGKISATHTQTNFIFIPSAPSDVFPSRGGVAELVSKVSSQESTLRCATIYDIDLVIKT